MVLTVMFAIWFSVEACMAGFTTTKGATFGDLCWGEEYVFISGTKFILGNFRRVIDFNIIIFINQRLRVSVIKINRIQISHHDDPYETYRLQEPNKY